MGIEPKGIDKMAKRKKKQVRGISPPGRVSFPKIFHPEAMNPGDTPKYQITIAWKLEELNEVDKKSFQAMIDAANFVSTDEFGVGYKEMIDTSETEEVELDQVDPEGHPVFETKPVLKAIRSPFRKGGKFHDKSELWVRFSTQDKPDVVDAMKQDIAEESNQVYPGMIARVSWSAGAYDRTGNIGVTFYLSNVQKTGMGDRLIGGPSADEEFDVVDTGEAEPANSNKSSDEIPF